MGIDCEIAVYGPTTQDMCDNANERLRHLTDGFKDDKYPMGFYLNNGTDSHYWDYDASYSTLWRWWGPGYERGPLFQIIEVLCTAVWAFPGCRVVYGSDHTDEIEWREFTPEYLSELLSHYMSDEGNDYYKAFEAAQVMMVRKKLMG
jgi:hypothetical protein